MLMISDSMSSLSDPPVLPADSPGSSVSSRLQDEYDDLIRHAVVLPNGNLQTISTRNSSTFVFPPRSHKDLIDLTSPEIKRADECHFTPPRRASIQSDDIPLHRCNSLLAQPIDEKMDQWYLDMKKNLMSEFDHLRHQFVEEAQERAGQERQSQYDEYVRLHEDIQTMKEMLIQYEHLIDQKDQIEQNLSKAMDLMARKSHAYQYYYQWRLMTIERQEQNYALSLAKRFYEDKLKRKSLSNWKLYFQREWKKRYELACEKKSKAILTELARDYEVKYDDLEMKLRHAYDELAHLRQEKPEPDEDIKKAFMRGVCALNLEAMNVLLNDPPSHSNHHTTMSDEGLLDDHDQSKSSSSYCAHRYLPTTVYRTGEARPNRSSSHHRYRTRSNQFLVERHVPVNHLPH